MLGMSGDEIILGNDAELGPTDPQIIINGVANPAHCILNNLIWRTKKLRKIIIIFQRGCQ